MLSTLNCIRSLMVSFTLLCLGVGLNNTLLGVRGTLEGYSDLTLGAMMSSYYAGFIIGTRLTERFISEVGQIRTFSALASLLSAITLLYVLLLDPVAWIALRFINGLCMAGAYLVIESWLNSLSTPQNRGRILSVYMILNSVGLASAQLFFQFANAEGFTLFALSSVLASIALVPLILSRTAQPSIFTAEPLPLKHVFTLSPLACIGAFSVGLTYSAFFGLAVPGLLHSGLNAEQGGEFLGAALLGGLLFQWPAGSLSDKFNRRFVVLVLTLSAAMLAFAIAHSLNAPRIDPAWLNLLAFMFGGVTYPLYSCFLSILNDKLEPDRFIKASSCLLTLNGAGAVIGPLAASILIYQYGPASLYSYIAAIHLLIGGTGLARLLLARGAWVKKRFVHAPRTANPVAALHSEKE